jgi:hypothetical protein
LADLYRKFPERFEIARCSSFDGAITRPGGTAGLVGTRQRAPKRRAKKTPALTKAVLAAHTTRTLEVALMAPTLSKKNRNPFAPDQVVNATRTFAWAGGVVHAARRSVGSPLAGALHRRRLGSRAMGAR